MWAEVLKSATTGNRMQEVPYNNITYFHCTHLINKTYRNYSSKFLERLQSISAISFQ